MESTSPTFSAVEEKDRALLLAGWRVVRFTAGEIRKNPDGVMTTLAAIVVVIEESMAQ